MLYQSHYIKQKSKKIRKEEQKNFLYIKCNWEGINFPLETND